MGFYFVRPAWALSSYNSPGQTAICGYNQAVQLVEDMVLNNGGQVTPLIGGAPFHSPLMIEASKKLKLELLNNSYSSFRYPVISNVTGLPYVGIDNISEVLANQLIYPVQWQKTMQYFQKFGVTAIIEMGSKNVLSKLVMANTSGIKALCFGTREDRRVLSENFLKDEQLKKHIPTVVTKCLAIAISTPNLNYDNDEYRKGVIEPYKKIWEMQNRLEELNEKPTIDQMIEAMKMLHSVFNTKKLPAEEQMEWFNQILDETGSNYKLIEYSRV